MVRLDAAELPPDLEYFLSANQWLDASNIPLERIVPSLITSIGSQLRSASSVEPMRQLSGRSISVPLSIVRPSSP